MSVSLCEEVLNDGDGKEAKNEKDKADAEDDDEIIGDEPFGNDHVDYLPTLANYYFRLSSE